MSKKMSCKKFEHYLSAYVDGEVSSSEKSTIEAHLENCSSCRETVKELRGIKMLLKEKAPRWKAEIQLEQTIRSGLAALPEKQGFFERLLDTVNLNPRKLIPVAAAAMALVLVFAVFWNHPTVYAEESFHDAISRHKAYCEGRNELGTTSSNPADVSKWYNERLSYKIVVPVSLDPNMVLKGGCLCSIGGTPVARIHYKRNSDDITFFESPLLGAEMTDELPSMNKKGVKYWYYNEDNCTTIYWETEKRGYYIVAFDEPDKLISIAETFQFSE